MEKVCILIPVAPFEPLSIIQKSVDSLKQLETSGLSVNITYIIDCPKGPDHRIRYLKSGNIGYLARFDTRGRRGGAINDGLDAIRGPDGILDADYIALFDVDSRPEPDFILECIDALKMDANAVIASGTRHITNQDSGWVARIIAAEYSFFADVYRLYERFDGFKQFNGLITVLAETKVGEQAPTSLKELYNQRIRWMSGALEGVEENTVRFYSAPIPVNQKLAWFTSMTLPFVAFLLTPIVPAYGFRLWSKGQDRILFKTMGLVFHVWLISFCGMQAILNRIRRKKTGWTDTSRSDI